MDGTNCPLHLPVHSSFMRSFPPISDRAMPIPDPDSSNEPSFADFNTPTAVEIKELIDKLQQSHELQYKLINLETWALAATMDSFIPGFWSRFLENRRTALKQFLKRKQTNNGKDAMPKSSSCEPH